MSEVEEEESGPVELEETGPFHPAIPYQIQAELGGNPAHATIGRRGHPPLACPDPRYMATLRGFYRCPACGAKQQLAGQIRAAEMGQELGERWAEVIAGGVGQAFRLTVDLVVYIIGGVVRAWNRFHGRRPAPENGAKMAQELIGMLGYGPGIKASETVSEAKECEVCDD